MRATGPGLLRDITEVFARERINVLSVRSNTRTDQARFNFIVEVFSAIALERVLGILREIPASRTAAAVRLHAAAGYRRGLRLPRGGLIADLGRKDLQMAGSVSM